MAPTGIITAFSLEAASRASGHVSSSQRMGAPEPPNPGARAVRSLPSGGLTIGVIPVTARGLPRAARLVGKQIQRRYGVNAGIAGNPDSSIGAVVADQLPTDSTGCDDAELPGRFDLH